MNSRTQPDERMPQTPLFMDPLEYGSGFQMYGGAFYEQDYNQTQPTYPKAYPKKEQMMPPGQSSSMYFQAPQADWNYSDGHQMPMYQDNFHTGYYQQDHPGFNQMVMHSTPSMNQMPMYQDTSGKKFVQPEKAMEYQSAYRPPAVEVLYSEANDGEITIEVEPTSGLRKLVTAIDISSLYKEKRNKSIQLAKKFETLYHEYLVSPLCTVILDGNKLYFQTEAPENGTTCWKAYCKKKFSTIEILIIFRQMCNVLHYLHSNDIIHRDVHPTRFHLVDGKAKFNFIGMPYNYKKLLKKDNFSGHINYSAPELILEQVSFTDKVDVWSLGCCLYFLIVKKDPFEGKDPKAIKENILKCNIDTKKIQSEPVIANLISLCLIVEEDKRPHAFELIKYLNRLEMEVYGRIVSDETKDHSLKLNIGSFKYTLSPNTSGNFNQSLENSFNSDNGLNVSGSKKSKFLEMMKDSNQPTATGEKKGMKLSCNSKEFVKVTNAESPIKNSNLKDPNENKLGGLKSGKYFFPSINTRPDGTKNFLISGERSPIIEEENEQKENIENLKIDQHNTLNLNFMQEENFGVSNQNLFTSFNTFNSSHIKEDQSFINSSFNTILNLNADLNEENNDLGKQLRQDLEANKLSGNMFKFRICFPQHGQLICNQYVVDLSSIKVLSVSQNPLGKIFMPKKSYLEYMLEKSDKADEVANDSISSHENKNTSLTQEKTDLSTTKAAVEKLVDLSKMKIEFIDGSSYSGKLVKHGQGIYKFANGDVYEGSFQNDQMHGYGKLTFSGEIPTLPSNKTEQSNGEKSTTNNGGVYSGCFEAGKFNGYGKLTNSDGSFFEGTWKQGKMDGIGTFYGSDGTVYTGEWKQNMKNGKGVLKDPENNILDGIWVDNEFSQSKE